MRETRRLGITYNDGDMIVEEGTESKEMYVVQSGKVRVVKSSGDAERLLAILKDGDIFGEMGLINRTTRSATVKAFGEATVLAIDKEKFLRMVLKDPAFAINILQQMGDRVRYLDIALNTTQKDLEEVSNELIELKEGAPAQEAGLSKILNELKVIRKGLIELKENFRARAEG